MTTDKQVVDYLQSNPDFFERHADLACSLILPTNSGDAISLIDFQIRKLREQIVLLRRENSHMIETARMNSVLFEKTRSLVLALLDARDLDDVAIALDEKLSKSFDVPTVRLILSSQFDSGTSGPIILTIDSNALSDGGELADAISDQKPWIGRLTKERRSLLFSDAHHVVESCATLPLVRGHTYGLLALGHPDPAHFQSNQDTLFLDHIGEALAMILPRLLEEAI